MEQSIEGKRRMARGMEKGHFSIGICKFSTKETGKGTAKTDMELVITLNQSPVVRKL
jgi:hypothetical protein